MHVTADSGKRDPIISAMGCNDDEAFFFDVIASKQHASLCIFLFGNFIKTLSNSFIFNLSLSLSLPLFL
jgi:hypothetical protein